MIKRRVCCALVCWAASAAAPAAARETQVPEPQLQWQPEYRSSGWVDVALLASSGGIALAGLLSEPNRGAPWRSTLGIDEDVRDGLRLTEPSARRTARTVSDVLAGVIVTYPAVVEAGANAALAKGSPRVGFELGVMQLEVLGLTAALVNTSKWLFSRERPYGRSCGSELDASSEDCASSDRYLSYFSGHSAFTFGSVTATCVQHARWQLWGSTPAWVPCATGYALAATTALLRVGADRHYISDVATGALVGTGVGLLVPWLRYGSAPSGQEQVSLRLGVTGNGVSLGGTF